MIVHHRLATHLALLVLALSACRGQSEQLRNTPESPKRVAPARSDDAPAGTLEAREATLFLMADVRGVLRPCGCTLELQKGGFDRLGPYLDSERKVREHHRLLHAGPLFFAKGVIAPEKLAQSERQAEVLADLVKKVGIDLAGATALDARAAKGKYAALVKRAGLHVTAANLTLQEGPTLPSVRIEAIGSVNVGIFALADPTHGGDALGIQVSDPKQAAQEAVAQLKEADVVVLLSGLGLRETKRLVRRVSGIDFAVVGGLGEHPVVSDEVEVVGGTRVMQFHREGRWIGRLSFRLVGDDRTFVGVNSPSVAEREALGSRVTQLSNALMKWAKTRKPDDPAVARARHQLAVLKTAQDTLDEPVQPPPAGVSSFSFRATALPWDLPQDPDILSLMNAFDEELKAINLKNAPILPKPKPGQAVYVGVETCMECHDETESYWAHDQHALAWETLEKGNKTFDTECVSCHVTGYGQAGGSIIGKTKGLEDVQCEACHGPGSLHAEAAEGQEKQTITLSPTEATCTACHNKHHSPDFDFKKYRKKLLVPGHGRPAR